MSARVVRFNRTERWVHAVQAISFLVLLFTGLAISLTFMESLVGHRALMRQVHLTAAFFFVFGPGLVALAGDRLAIGSDIHEVDSWAKDDIRWLAHPSTSPDARTPPAGRYNAGQKLNAIFTVYCTVAFGITGLILWQNRQFPYSLVSQANTIHQWLAYFALVVFLGHLYLSVVHPATRAAFSGIILGTVGADWAKHHHPKWVAPPAPETRLRGNEVVRSLVLLGLGLECMAIVSRFGLELLGAVNTDPVIKLIYRVTGFPGTVQHAASTVHTWDLGALLWLGLGMALWYGAMRRHSLLPRIFPAPAKG